MLGLPVLRFGAILGIAITTLSAGTGAARAYGATLTCALLVEPELGLANSPFADLVAAQLSAGAGLRLLDRAEIDKILAEHRLALSGASDTPAWQSVGRVLRADLLVHLWARENDEGKTIEYELIDTSSALRLGRGAVVWDDDLAARTELIAGRIASAAGRMIAGVQQVLAVPPFESGDFAYDVAGRRYACAALLEEYLSQVPGVAVVEFVHADQVAHELSLSRGSAGVERDLPVYVTGWLSDAAADPNAIDIRITARRGDQVLWQDDRAGLAVADLSGFLQSAADAVALALSSAGASGLVSTGDPRKETRLLAEQVRARRIQGEWLDVVRVGEACLLIAPDNWWLHKIVGEAYGYLAVDRVLGRDAPETESSEMVFSRMFPPLQRRAHALAGTAHWDTSFRNTPAVLDDLRAFSRFIRQTSMPTITAEVVPAQRELLERQRDALVHLIHATGDDVAKAGGSYLYASCWCLLETSGYRDGPADPARLEAFVQLTSALDRHQRLYYSQIRLLLDWQPKTDSPSVQQAYDDMLARLQSRSAAGAARAARLVALLRTPVPADPAPVLAEVDRLLDVAELADAGRVYLRNAARRRFQPHGDELMIAPDRAFSIGDLQFTPLALRERLWKEQRFQWWRGTRVAEVGTDRFVVCGRDGAVLVRVPDELIRLDLGEAEPTVADSVYDGKYLWVALHTRDRAIHVFDPETGKPLAVFTVADGTYACSAGARLASLGPGRVLVVGAFGRTWAATLALDANGRKRVQVFFAADHQAPEGAPAWYAENPVDTAFVPEEINLIPETPQAPALAVVWRPGMTPLLAELATRQVQVAPQAWGATGMGTLVYGDGVLVPFYERGVGWLDPRAKTIERFPGVNFGGLPWHIPFTAARSGDTYHIIGAHWWTLDLAEHRMLRDIPLPEALQKGYLVHCALGLVFYGNSPHWKDSGVWRVTMAPDPLVETQTGE